MQKALQFTAQELTKIRAGKASPAMVDGLRVDYYGNPTPLSQVANVSTPDNRTILIKPWEKPMLAEITKAIRNSDLSLNPQQEADAVRLNIPPLTEERRKEIVKSLGSKVEDCRIALRNIRHDVLGEVKKLEKAKEATSDDVKFAEAELNKKIDQYQRKIEEIEAAKAKEIMEV